jgi:hypothetical protein
MARNIAGQALDTTGARVALWRRLETTRRARNTVGMGWVFTKARVSARYRRKTTRTTMPAWNIARVCRGGMGHGRDSGRARNVSEDGASVRCDICGGMACSE